MKTFVALALSLSLLFSVGFAENYASMSSADLAEMRDAINNELSSRENQSLQENSISLKTDLFSITITDIYEADRKEVNALYDQYKPGTGSSDEAQRMIILFTFENNSDADMASSFISRDASINGWMTSAYCGLKDVPAKKKAKGFINVILRDCDADHLQDVNSCELYVDLRDTDRKKLLEGKIILIQTDSGWIVNQE